MGSINSRRFEKQKVDYFTKDEKLDLYSFTSSLVFHILLLLTMTLIGVAQATSPPIKLHISWSNNENMASESIEEIELDLPVENLAHVDAQENTISEIVEIPRFDIPDTLEHNPQVFTLVPEADMLNELLIKDQQNLPERSLTVQNDISSILDSFAGSVREGLRSSGRNTGNQFDNTNNINKRLSLAGAKTGDIQISIAWNTVDDIDLHIEFSPGNGLIDRINWINKVGRLFGGMLDIDMNANQLILNPKPVENVFWPPNSSPSGDFNVYVHFFRSWTGNTNVPVYVVIKSMGEVFEYNIIAKLGMSLQHVTSFSTKKKKVNKF